MTVPLAAVVMAAGLGTRMRSATPKHLHPLLGRRMVDWVTGTVRMAGADPVVIVVSEETQDAFPGETTAVQRDRAAPAMQQRARGRRSRASRATCWSRPATRRS